ncbi:MAG: hypothetical protein QNJ68_03415 [Microcoleaceae cyanobacterium MO_207.B10]|nr:hypothetical protein [Microcoleaceae cyanobacterium MO_207.B10]
MQQVQQLYRYFHATKPWYTGKKECLVREQDAPTVMLRNQNNDNVPPACILYYVVYLDENFYKL